MKYTIVINQLALQQIAPNLDIIDATILDYLIHFCSAEDAKIARITFTEGGTTRKFVWINYKQLINELPIIKIKSKSAISSRVARIEKEGFIKTKQEFGTKGRLYVLLTEKIKELYFSSKGSSTRTVEGEKEGLVFVQTNIQHSNKRVESKDSTEEKTLPEVQGSKKNNPIRQVIGFFIEACENIKGFKPRVTPGVSGAIIQKYLKDYSVEEITDELSWFLNAELSKKLSCTLQGALSAHVFNKWLEQRETYN